MEDLSWTIKYGIVTVAIVKTIVIVAYFLYQITQN